MPHDKIYAVLGLLERLHSVGVALPIQVDYEILTADLYVATAFYFVKHMANLHMLSLVEEPIHRIRQGLPSWALDFGSHVKTVLPHILPTGFTNACGSCSSSSSSRKLSGITLELEGTQFDKITTVTRHFFDAAAWLTASGRLATLRFLEKALILFALANAYREHSVSKVGLLVNILLVRHEALRTPPTLIESSDVGTQAYEVRSTMIDAATLFGAWARLVIMFASKSGIRIESTLSIFIYPENNNQNASIIWCRRKSCDYVLDNLRSNSDRFIISCTLCFHRETMQACRSWGSNRTGESRENCVFAISRAHIRFNERSK